MPDILNIIHLDRREDRLQNLMEQTAEQGIAYKLWPGITENKNVITNISQAHKKIVRYAKENGMKQVHIAEDDLVFTGKGAWKYYLKNIPADYFDLYCGLLYAGQTKGNAILSGRMSGSLTLYTISRPFYSAFLSADEKINLDWQLGKWAGYYNYYVCSPFVVKQMSGFSDHFKKDMNYTAFEENKNFYGQ